MYAITIEIKGERDPLVKLDVVDLTDFLDQYHAGELVFRGRTLSKSDIQQIRVLQYNEPTSTLRARAQKEHEKLASSGFISALTIPLDVKAANLGQDVTDQFITRPMGSGKTAGKLHSERGRTESKSVFVVHGHDKTVRLDLERFLHSVGLDPIVLHRLPNEGMTVIEKFERHADVLFAFILLTPDDWGYSNSEKTKDDQARSYERRARQNVLFEWGYFTAKLGRPNVCVLNAGVELPSDMAGLVWERIGDDGIDPIESRLRRELRRAGVKIAED